VNGIEIRAVSDVAYIDFFQGGDRCNRGLWSDPRENDRMYM